MWLKILKYFKNSHYLKNLTLSADEYTKGVFNRTPGTSSQFNPEDIAVIYKNNAHALDLVSILAQMDIPVFLKKKNKIPAIKKNETIIDEINIRLFLKLASIFRIV